MEFTTHEEGPAIQEARTEVIELKEIKRIQVLRWFSCDKKKPLHQQEVIISVNREHHVAIFDADRDCFSLKYNSRVFFSPTEQTIEWVPAA